jgi:hypothetical protein
MFELPPHVRASIGPAVYWLPPPTGDRCWIRWAVVCRARPGIPRSAGRSGPELKGQKQGGWSYLAPHSLFGKTQKLFKRMHIGQGPSPLLCGAETGLFLAADP